LRALKPLLREQIAELPSAIFALRPIQFDELGFVGSRHRYITEFGEQQGWSMEIDLSGLSAFLSPQLEATVFRLVQEALTNAAKPANASGVTGRYTQVDGGLQFIIRDNRRGFHPGIVSSEGGQLGLRQIRERLTARHGRLTILSQPGAGAERRVWLPTDAIQASRQKEKRDESGALTTR
jgi:signal transduction histidine kinase